MYENIQGWIVLETETNALDRPTANVLFSYLRLIFSNKRNVEKYTKYIFTFGRSSVSLDTVDILPAGIIATADNRMYRFQDQKGNVGKVHLAVRELGKLCFQFYPFIDFFCLHGGRKFTYTCGLLSFVCYRKSSFYVKFQGHMN